MGSLAFRPLLDRKRMHVAVPNALPEGGLEIDGPAVLFEEVAKRLLGKRLKIHAPIERKQRNGLPRLVVELNAFAGHDQLRKCSIAFAACCLKRHFASGSVPAGLSPERLLARRTIPACKVKLDSGFRRNDERESEHVTDTRVKPAYDELKSAPTRHGRA
jgi:hypothetical protein